MDSHIKKLFPVVVTLALSAAHVAEAISSDDGAGSLVSVRGFGTVGVAKVTNGRYGAISSFGQQHPVRNEWSPYLDSVLGLQADIKASDNNTLVFQGMWRPGDSDSPLLQLGYWESRPWMSTKFRIGRIPTPMFRETEYFHIGYARLAVRPAMPVYTKLSAISHLDGGDFRWQFESGDWVYGLQLFGGNSAYSHQAYLDGYEPFRAKVSQMRGVVIKAISGNFTVRVSHTLVGSTSYESNEITALTNGIDSAAMGLKLNSQNSQAEQLEMYRNLFDSKNIQYSSIGVDWLPENWQLIGEMTLLDPNSHTLGISKAWKLLIGRDFGNFTPYVLFSSQNTKRTTLNESAFAGPLLAPLRDELVTAIRRADLSMRSFGAGVRFEINANQAVKFQVEKLRWNVPYADSLGDSSEQAPRTTLFSVVMDFVF